MGGFFFFFGLFVLFNSNCNKRSVTSKKCEPFRPTRLENKSSVDKSENFLATEKWPWTVSIHAVLGAEWKRALEGQCLFLSIMPGCARPNTPSPKKENKTPPRGWRPKHCPLLDKGPADPPSSCFGTLDLKGHTRTSRWRSSRVKWIASS